LYCAFVGPGCAPSEPDVHSGEIQRPDVSAEPAAAAVQSVPDDRVLEAEPGPADEPPSTNGPEEAEHAFPAEPPAVAPPPAMLDTGAAMLDAGADDMGQETKRRRRKWGPPAAETVVAAEGPISGDPAPHARGSTPTPPPEGFAGDGDGAEADRKRRRRSR
jgi:hypothetical protein